MQPVWIERTCPRARLVRNPSNPPYQEGAIRIERIRQRARWFGRLSAGLLGAVLMTTSAGAAPESELLAGWDASDETNTARIDHSAWQGLLDAYLKTHPSGVNRFDYAALKANAEDTATLASYLTALQSIDPRTYARAEQQAYWINFYNALTVHVVLGAYPVDTIRDIHEGWIPRTGPWNDVHAKVAGKDLTLNDVEHGILRPIWRDNRIHYAVNCASYGCPNLSAAAFTAENTEALLDAAARAYVNHPRGVDFVDDDSLVISSIYDWYAADFGDSEAAVIEHLVHYAEADLVARLKNFAGSVDYTYDWSLNQP